VGCTLLSFKVVGPLKVHYSKNVGGRTIRDVDIASFWSSHAKYKKRRGCYVFSMRTGGGLRPGYVGKTKKNFKQEVFGAHQLTRYYEFMARYKVGRPVFFLVVADQAMGKPNDSKIRAVEKYLIDLGLTANPDLLNKRDTKPPGWGIQGVIRGGLGKVSSGTSSFRKMLGIVK
jgi:hypothetical protein